MPHYVYILHSSSLKKYYCGETQDFELRFKLHNTAKNKYTKAGVPWVITKIFEVDNRIEGRALEKKIKGRGIKRFLDGLNNNASR